MTNQKQPAMMRPISPVTSEDGPRATIRKCPRKIPVPNYGRQAKTTSSAASSSSSVFREENLAALLANIPDAQPDASDDENFPDAMDEVLAPATITVGAQEPDFVGTLFENMDAHLIQRILKLDTDLVLQILERQSVAAIDYIIKEADQINLVWNLCASVKAKLFLRASQPVFRQIWTCLEQKEKHGLLASLLEEDMKLVLGRLIDLE
jgi:hypothetical protein